MPVSRWAYCLSPDLPETGRGIVKGNIGLTSLYDESGQVASHFLNEEFYSFCDTWEHAMAHEQFAQIIDIELEAEPFADAPLDHLASLAPSERVRNFFAAWLGFIDNELESWTTGGAIHYRPHWARVLMHALVIADALGLPDADMRCLAMAAVFHDSRRKSPYLDTGHGARAASYYVEACRVLASRDATGTEAGKLAAQLVYDPRTMLAIAWHDRDDDRGLQAIAQAVADDDAPGSDADSFAASLPPHAEAEAETILRIFKDADGLDRVRLGKGGLDERFLRTDQARSQVPFAHELLAASMVPRPM